MNLETIYLKTEKNRWNNLFDDWKRMFCLREDTLSDQGIFDLKRVLEKRYILKKNILKASKNQYFGENMLRKKNRFWK